jgi:hypothetical protein
VAAGKHATVKSERAAVMGECAAVACEHTTAPAGESFAPVCERDGSSAHR